MRTREYAGRADLRAMQRLVQEAWAVVGSKNERHVGDVAWADTHIPGRQDEFRRVLFEEEGRVVAWAWLFRPSTLDYQLRPGRSELLETVLDWFEDVAEADELSTSALASDAEARERLRVRGYEPEEDGPWFAYLAHDLTDLPAPAPPDGFELRTMRGDEDIPARAAVHQAAWKPSRVTEASVRDTMGTWPYRADLDCVAEGPDGRFGAYALAWYDDANRVGELEPVGTVPELRRHGLGRAVNLFALRRLHEVGAATAIVYCRGDDAYPAPKLLYESVGFRAHDRSVSYVKRGK